MTDYVVSSGQTSSGISLSPGDTAEVLSGGTAISLTDRGGTETVSAGGFDLDTTLQDGTEIVFGTATRTILNGQVSARFHASPVQQVLSGGLVVSAELQSYGSQVVSAGGTTSLTVVDNATNSETILSGGTSISTTLLSGGGGIEIISSGGTAIATTISRFGVEIVSAGGTAIGTTIASGGTLLLIDNASDPQLTWSPGGALALGSKYLLSGASISDGQRLLVESGGGTLSTTINGGGVETVVSNGIASATTISSGGTLVEAGGSAKGLIWLSGGTLGIGSGGFYLSGPAASGGQELALLSGGNADFMTIASGGSVTVSSGGELEDSSIGAGGLLTVASGAELLANSVTSGGSLVLSAGDVRYTVINSGGTETIFGSTQVLGEAIASGGSETVLNGASTNSAIINGGMLTISSGGIVFSPTISGPGSLLALLSGAVLSGSAITFAGNGGELLIGGSAMPSATLSGLAPSDVIDLASVPFDSTGSAVVDFFNELRITEGGRTYSLQLDPAQDFAGRVFAMSDDGSGGTRVTEVTAVASDLNGDGRSDILLHNNVSGSFVDWTMGGSTITAAQNLTFGGAPVALDPSWSVPGIGDFNGDDKTDILLQNSNGSFADWTMSGAAIGAAQNLTFNGAAVGLDSSWWVPGLGDFNGDGKADILLRHSDGTFVDWTMDGSTITAAANLTLNGSAVDPDFSWFVATLGDFNGDGRTDILLRNSTTGSLTDWTMNGAAITAAQSLTFNGAAVGIDGSWTILGSGDFNGDGKADILLRNTDGSFVDWTMSGSTIVSAATLSFQGNPVSIDNSWTFADIGDYNGDGKADILLRNTSGSFVDWTMNGATIASAGSVTFQGNAVFLDNSWQTS